MPPRPHVSEGVMSGRTMTKSRAEGQDCVVGLDLATQHARASVVGADGLVLAEASVPLAPPVRTGEGGSTQDATTWWPAVAEALRRVTAELDSARAIVAVSVSSTSATVVLVDSDADPTTHAVLYDDRLATAEIDRARGTFWAGEYPGMARMEWLAATVPAKGTVAACHAADILNWKLAGQRCESDWSHALKSGYDPQAGAWAPRALALADSAARLLGPVTAPGTLVGRVCADAAAETGLAEGTEIRLGMTDGCTAQIACGAAQAGEAVSVLGTTLVIKGTTPHRIDDPSAGVYSHRHPEGHWLPGGASNTGGEALASFGAGRLVGLDREAEAYGPSGILCYPLSRQGERFPFNNTRARGFQLGDPSGEVASYRANLEGVAYLERLGYETLEGLGMGYVASPISAGGGNKSPLWLRIRAATLGRPLQTVADASSGKGAAIIAAGGSLYGDLAAASAAMVHPASVVEPEPALVGVALEGYGRFKEALRDRGLLARPQ